MVENIVVVTDSLSIDGGSASVALSSAMALARTGLHVTVFAAAGTADAELSACRNLRVVSTGQGDALSAGPVGILRGLWNRKAQRMMTELLSTMDRRHTVVHLHGWTKALSSSVVASIVAARFPIVLTLHEYFTACPNGCLYLHRDRQICTLKPMSLACITKDCDSRSYAFKLYRVLRQVIQKTAGRIPDGIAHFITVSDFSRSILEKLLPAGRRLYAVDNPVESIRHPRIRAELNETVVFVGRLSAEKGGLLLAEAARLAGIKIQFIGAGPERAVIEEKFPEAEFAGWLDRAALAAAMLRARLVVVPSLWYETLGLVVLEAAALGIPALVPNGTAARELVVPGVTGLTFERGDVEDLAAQLRASKDDARIEHLSKAAYGKFWSSPPTMEAHVGRLLSTYGAVLGDAREALQLAPSS